MEIQQIIHVLHREFIEYLLLIPHTGCFLHCYCNSQ